MPIRTLAYFLLAARHIQQTRQKQLAQQTSRD